MAMEITDYKSAYDSMVMERQSMIKTHRSQMDNLQKQLYEKEKQSIADQISLAVLCHDFKRYQKRSALMFIGVAVGAFLIGVA